MQGTLYGINTDSTTPATKTAAAGLTVSMQNIIGYALGPLLPGVPAEITGQAIRGRWPEEPIQAMRAAQFSVGMALGIAVVWPLALVVLLAKRSVPSKKDSDSGGGS